MPCSHGIPSSSLNGGGGGRLEFLLSHTVEAGRVFLSQASNYDYERLGVFSFLSLSCLCLAGLARDVGLNG